MTGRTVCVRGIPTDLSPERAADKLTIHFLRACNGGGEILDIDILPESPACALVTFEEAEVAQRVLKVEKHVLSISGKKYPLKVTAQSADLSPDEIFVRVCMTIDYGRFPDGKSILRSLRKRYSDVQFSFDAKETLCAVKGPFTELQAFVTELLSLLGRGSPQKASRSKSMSATDSQQGFPETQEIKDQERKEEAGLPLLRDPVDGEAVEDFSLVMDSDIYLYMQKFCNEEIGSILRRHQVDMVDVSSEGIATLYLQASSQSTRGMGALSQAHLELLKLYQQLEGTLRKEKISKGELGAGSRGLPGELQQLCPLLLCHEEEGHVSLIGNLVDVSQAKQHVQDLIAGRGAMQAPRVPSAAMGIYSVLRPGGSAVPGRSEPPVEPTLRRHELKGESKLAANFSLSKPEAFLSSLSRDTPFTRGSLKETGYGSLNSQRPLQVTELGPQVVSATETLKASDKMKAGALLRPKALPSFGSAGQSPGSWKGLGPVKPQTHDTMSSAFRSLSLFDTTGTYSALDSKAPESRAPLRRSNSFSLPRSKGNEKPKESPGEPLASDRICLDSLQWAYLKDIHRPLLEEICREGGVQITERTTPDSTVLTLRADDRAKIPAAKQKIESLCLVVRPDFVCQCLSYVELDVDGPSNEALKELCGLLSSCSDRLVLSRDQYKLYLTYPREVQPRVSEVFRQFSSQGLSVPASLPGTEQSLSNTTQQDLALGKEYWRSQMGFQQVEPGSTAGLSETQSQPGGTDEAKLFSTQQSAQSYLSTSAFQPATEAAYWSDEKGGGGRQPNKTPDAGSASRQGKLAAEVKRGLPDKFHFARDWGKGGQSEEADGTAQSLPGWLLGSDAAMPLRAIEPSPTLEGRLPPAGDSDMQEPERRGASPRQEAQQPAAGKCDLCQSSCTATCRAPCGHALCRTCFSIDDVSPACCSAVSIIRGAFKAKSMSQSLPGYYRDPTLKIVYEVPNGVQRAGDPRPGSLYQGGRFEAFLPDNHEGQRMALLLHKAFKRGLTFQIRSQAGEERVTWGPIPHKTSMDGGKIRNGYPDNQYLRELCTKLKSLDIE
uniref:RING-type E3 ubiquitin transferase n=1 Tax=Sphenodon punctatus TaxID=8508 RepID=A0A8D0GGQ2_SPHPU